MPSYNFLLRLYRSVLLFVAIFALVACKPTATSDRYATRVDKPLDILLSGSDPDGDSLTYRLVTQPKHGVLQGAPPELVYTPNAGFKGVDTFNFKTNDGEADSNLASIEVTVIEKAGRAILGPVVNASVSVYRLDNTTSPIYQTITTNSYDLEIAGLIPLPPAPLINADELYLVTVTGGEDIDPDDDGHMDDIPARVSGTIHGIFLGRHINQGIWNVSAVTDAIYYRVKSLLLFNADDASIIAEINYRARLLLSQDITGDNVVDIDDLIQWHPVQHAHVFRRSNEQLQTLISRIHGDDDAQTAADQLTKTKSEIATLDFNSVIYSIAQDGGYLYVGSDEGVGVYSMADSSGPRLIRNVRFPPYELNVENGWALSYQENHLAIGRLGIDYQVIEFSRNVSFARLVNGTLAVVDRRNDLHLYKPNESGEYIHQQTKKLTFNVLDLFEFDNKLALLTSQQLNLLDLVGVNPLLEFQSYPLANVISKYATSENNILYLKSDHQLYRYRLENQVLVEETKENVVGQYFGVNNDYLYVSGEGASSFLIYDKESLTKLGTLPSGTYINGMTIYNELLIEWGYGGDNYDLLISDARIPPVTQITGSFKGEMSTCCSITGNEQNLFIGWDDGIKKFALDEAGDIVGESIILDDPVDKVSFYGGFLFGLKDTRVIAVDVEGDIASVVSEHMCTNRHSELYVSDYTVMAVDYDYIEAVNFDTFTAPDSWQRVETGDDGIYNLQHAYRQGDRLFVSAMTGLYIYDVSVPGHRELLAHWNDFNQETTGVEWIHPFGDYLVVKVHWDDPVFYVLSYDGDQVVRTVSRAELGSQLYKEQWVQGNRMYAISGYALFVSEISHDGNITLLGHIALPHDVHDLFVNRKGVYFLYRRDKGIGYIKFPQ